MRPGCSRVPVTALRRHWPGEGGRLPARQGSQAFAECVGKVPIGASRRSRPSQAARDRSAVPAAFEEGYLPVICTIAISSCMRSTPRDLTPEAFGGDRCVFILQARVLSLRGGEVVGDCSIGGAGQFDDLRAAPVHLAPFYSSIF